jgi:hypothetical protein
MKLKKTGIIHSDLSEVSDSWNYSYIHMYINYSYIHMYINYSYIHMYINGVPNSVVFQSHLRRDTIKYQKHDLRLA